MAPALDLFNAGEGFTIDDPIGASWFNVFPCAEGADIAQCADGYPAFGGADSRVLIAQITATGDVYGIFNLQVFPNGIQSEQLQSSATFSTNEADIFGCTNTAATNYDPSATVDDLSCVLPCMVSLSLDNVTSSNLQRFQRRVDSNDCNRSAGRRRFLPRRHRRLTPKFWQLRQPFGGLLHSVRCGRRRLFGFS